MLWLLTTSENPARRIGTPLLIESENLRLTRYEVILEAALSYLEVLEKKKLIE